MDLNHPSDVLVEVVELPRQTLRTTRDLLQHSFYRRWVSGDLSLDELRNYSSQYAHVVTRLPAWLRMTAPSFPGHQSDIEEHANEEDAHIPLWTEFAVALGVSPKDLASSRPNKSTAELLNLGDQLSGRPIGVVLAWALEIQTPAVSVEKLRGLEAYYGIDANSGGSYFEVHSSRDLAHGGQTRDRNSGSPSRPASESTRSR